MTCKNCIFYNCNTDYGMPFDECINEYDEDINQHWGNTSADDKGAENCIGFWALLS